MWPIKNGPSFNSRLLRISGSVCRNDLSLLNGFGWSPSWPGEASHPHTEQDLQEAAPPHSLPTPGNCVCACVWRIVPWWSRSFANQTPSFSREKIFTVPQLSVSSSLCLSHTQGRKFLVRQAGYWGRGKTTRRCSVCVTGECVSPGKSDFLCLS